MLPDGHVSTGHLPPAADVRDVVDQAYQEYRRVNAAANSRTYPALTQVPPHHSPSAPPSAPQSCGITILSVAIERTFRSGRAGSRN